MTLTLFIILGLIPLALFIYLTFKIGDEFHRTPLPTIALFICLVGWYGICGQSLFTKDFSENITEITVIKGKNLIVIESAAEPMTYKDAFTYNNADKIKQLKITKRVNIYGTERITNISPVFEELESAAK